MRKTGFICDESFFWHDAGSGALFFPAGGYVQVEGSSENPETKRRFKNLLERSGLYDQLYLVKPRPAKEEQIGYFHTKEYIERVKKVSASGGGEAGPHVNIGQDSYEIAQLAAGAAIVAVESVVIGELNNAYALTRPPGHHAEAHQANGYCVFNNAVIAAHYARKELGLERIMILDWDVHHGNGIEDAFYDDPNVLFVSIHQEGYYPIGRGKVEDRGEGEGKGYNYNIPLLAGTGDAGYIYAFEQIIKPLADEFKPQLIIVAAGQDANIFDPLARMMVSSNGFRQMTKIIREIAEAHCEGKMIVVHEGGYSAAYVPFCSHAIVEELSSIQTDVDDPFIGVLRDTRYDVLLPHQKERVDEIKSAVVK